MRQRSRSPAMRGRGFGGVPWTPAAHPGYAPSPHSFAALRAGGRLFQDRAATVPAVAHLDDFSAATCDGVQYTIPSGATPCKLYDLGAGRWGVRWTNLTRQLFGDVTTQCSAMTAGVMAWRASADGFRADFEIGSSPRLAAYSYGYFQIPQKSYPGQLRAVRIETQVPVARGLRTVVVQSGVGAGWTRRQNGAQDISTTANFSPPTMLAVGGSSTTADGPAVGFSGVITGMPLFKTALSAGDLALLEAYLDAQWTPPGLLACDGNSLMVGTGLSAGQLTLPDRVSNSLMTGQRWDVMNFGVSSTTTPVMTAAAVKAIDIALLAPLSVPKKVCVVWEVTNDLYFGASAATALADIKAYCAARRAAGWYVIVLTVLPRSGFSTPGTFEADRQTCNAEIRNAANLGVSWDAVADVAGDARVGAAGADLGAYFLADHTHLNDAGTQIAADIVTVAVLAA